MTVDFAEHSDDAAKGTKGISVQRLLKRVGERRPERGPRGVGVLNDGDRGQSRRVGAEFVHQSPGCIGVKEIEVGQRTPGQLGHPVPPRRRTGDAITSANLVGVFAVARHFGRVRG